MLREEILSGRIKDGEEITQEDLASQLEVSRMPVREALQILELEGLLLRLPNRHMKVVGINEKTVFENFRLIASVEAEIGSIILEQKKYEPIQDEVHSWITNNISNVYLKQNLKRLLSGYPKYVLEHSDKEVFAEFNTKIIIAFQNKDSLELNKSIKAYYNKMAEQLLVLAKGERV